MKHILYIVFFFIFCPSFCMGQENYKTEEGVLWKLDERTGHWIDPYRTHKEHQPARYRTGNSFHKAGALKQIQAYYINPENNEECYIAYKGTGAEQLFVRRYEPLTYSYLWEELTPLVVSSGATSILTIAVSNENFNALTVTYTNGEQEVIRVR